MVKHFDFLLTLTSLKVTKIKFLLMGGSRKYPYPYHGRHLGIPKGRGVTSTGILRTWGGYVDWNSEDMGGFIGLEFRRHTGFSGE